MGRAFHRWRIMLHKLYFLLPPTSLHLVKALVGRPQMKTLWSGQVDMEGSPISGNQPPRHLAFSELKLAFLTGHPDVQWHLVMRMDMRMRKEKICGYRHYQCVHQYLRDIRLLLSHKHTHMSDGTMSMGLIRFPTPLDLCK